MTPVVARTVGGRGDGRGCRLPVRERNYRRTHTDGDHRTDGDPDYHAPTDRYTDTDRHTIAVADG